MGCVPYKGYKTVSSIHALRTAKRNSTHMHRPCAADAAIEALSLAVSVCTKIPLAVSSCIIVGRFVGRATAWIATDAALPWAGHFGCIHERARASGSLARCPRALKDYVDEVVSTDDLWAASAYVQAMERQSQPYKWVVERDLWYSNLFDHPKSSEALRDWCVAQHPRVNGSGFDRAQRLVLTRTCRLFGCPFDSRLTVKPRSGNGRKTRDMTVDGRGSRSSRGSAQ